MSGVSYEKLEWLHLLWAVLGVALLGAYGAWQRRRALRAFAEAHLLPRLATLVSLRRAIGRLALLLLALTALVAALIDPRWGAGQQQVYRRNVDVMVLLDVSRSMLARDMAPDRLERAKLAIRDDLLPALGGDRVGLIAFAGRPVLKCPLTNDYGFFRLALDDVDTQSAAVGGTLIGDAIRKTEDCFQKQLDTHRVILLITDGEDHESYPVEAAHKIWDDLKVPIVAVALGDPRDGARIPLDAAGGEKYLTHDGEVVWSRADFPTLREMAEVSPEGAFVPVGTRDFDLGRIYRELIVPQLRSRERVEQEAIERPARAHYFAVIALVALLSEALLREAPRRRSVPAAKRRRCVATGASPWEPRSRPPQAPTGRQKFARTAVGLILAGFALCVAAAETPRELAARGQANYAAGKYADALSAFEQAASAAGDESSLLPELLHNQAACRFKLGQLDDARELWVRAATHRDPNFEAAARFNLGNCDYAAALQTAQSGDSGAALKSLGQAAVHYQEALRLDPGLANARANLELAAMLRKQIEEQRKSQPQTQSSQPNEGEQGEPSDQSQSQPSTQPQEREPSDSEQSSDEQSEQPQTQPSAQPDESSTTKPEPEMPPEESPERPPEENPPPEESPATQPSPAPLPETQPAAEEQPPEDARQVTLQLTPEQAARLLQLIRDRERERREQLARRAAAENRRPVEKDW